jgi:hypothetical protein
MIFPFELTFKKKIEGELENFSTHDILNFAKEDFKKSGATNIRLTNDSLTTINPFGYIGIRPGLNWNRWVGISRAEFKIKPSKNHRIAYYTFNLTRVIILGVIAGILAGIIELSFWIGLITFGLFGIVHWISKVWQHKFVFYDTFFDLIARNKQKIFMK